MSIRDGIFTTVAVAVSGIALAGLLGTDAYSRAAGLEARGLHALTAQVQMACAGDCVGSGNMVQLEAGLTEQEAAR